MSRLFFAALMLISSCTTIASDLTHKTHKAHAASQHTKKTYKKFKQIGIASWYGYQHAGRPTKSGEIFHPLWATAAHNTLPMGTKVRVTNLENNRKIIVKINDTGNFSKYGRIIDLSLGAARVLGITGLAKVKIEVI